MSVSQNTKIQNIFLNLKVKKSGKIPADPRKMELALLFIRLFRSLDAIAGGDANTVRSWMYAENLALCGRPVDRIQTITGLIDVLGYLDSRRVPLKTSRLCWLAGKPFLRTAEYLRI